MQIQTSGIGHPDPACFFFTVHNIPDDIVPVIDTQSGSLDGNTGITQQVQGTGSDRISSVACNRIRLCDNGIFPLCICDCGICLFVGTIDKLDLDLFVGKQIAVKIDRLTGHGNCGRRIIDLFFIDPGRHREIQADIEF